MKSKIFLLTVYVFFIWLVGIFVFGKSGILDNIYQSKEIERLNEMLVQSNFEIEKMNREYQNLLKMKTPDSAFLIDQGKKLEDIVIFKEKTILNNMHGVSSNQEKSIFFRGAVLGLMILFLGFISIWVMTFFNNKYKKADRMEKNDSI